MGKKISEHVAWVGKTDWELKRFHGDELSTNRGSSYNSYLVRDEKTVLIDTVWQPFAGEFVSGLKRETDLGAIDCIVMNHGETDHSGALSELMREIPDTPIYCTKNGEDILRGHYHENWNFVTVKTGDVLPLGKTSLTFIEAPMLHWPDTMFSYLSGDNILFSSDGFGQHFASESLFNDTVNRSALYEEAKKYYANILAIYSSNAARKISEISAMNLPVAMIAPSHGVIWRDDPMQIVRQYAEWADSYRENRITVIYDTMWNATRKMAENIARGITDADPAVTVKVMNASKEDKSDMVTEVFRSKAVLIGSPTVNYGYTYAVAGLLELIRGMRLKGKNAAAFGSYGWSGDAPGRISGQLRASGFNVVSDELKIKWAPGESDLAKCREYGAAFAKAVAGKTPEQIKTKEAKDTEKYVCPVCGYVYDPAGGDPDGGVPAGTPFDQLPENWRCPLCKVPKAKFKKAE